MTSKEAFEVTYKGEKYEIGNFISRHPGGSEILIPYKNKDITAAFDHISHSNDAKYLLKKRKIGVDLQASVTKKVTKSSSSNSLASEDTADNYENNTDTGSVLSDEEKFNKKKFIVRKLFTEEDTFNVHKTLGFLVLLSYAYRYFYVLPTTGTLGISHDALSYFTLSLHMFLSLSS